MTTQCYEPDCTNKVLNGHRCTKCKQKYPDPKYHKDRKVEAMQKRLLEMAAEAREKRLAEEAQRAKDSQKTAKSGGTHIEKDIVYTEGELKELFS